MADPKLEIEKRLDNLELAIRKMNEYLVNAPLEMSTEERSEEIEKILRGENAG